METSPASSMEQQEWKEMLGESTKLEEVMVVFSASEHYHLLEYEKQ